MFNLHHTLDIILEDGDISSNTTMAAKDLAKQLEDIQRNLASLQHQLTIAHNKMCGELALTIRRQMPSLNVGVGRDGCKIGYRTKHLVFNPDSKSGVWKLKSNDQKLVRKFMRLYGSRTVINNDLQLLADAIVMFFKNHYKSLGENIIGTGVVLIENRRGAITDLANWYKSQQFSQSHRLNSRSVRTEND